MIPAYLSKRSSVWPLLPVGMVALLDRASLTFVAMSLVRLLRLTSVMWVDYTPFVLLSFDRGLARSCFRRYSGS